MDFQQLSTFCDGIPGLDRRWRSIEDLPDDGVGKRDLMPAQHGDAWQVMGAIKQALDPLNIRNPGKMVPPRN